MNKSKAANRLIHEKSPYLLQHAHNLVDWYPWGEEAFAKARAEDKPVFLSIGYSSCHWCHVMSHESFEDTEVASLLNAHFVAVKVDKEERPDIDSIYMAVCQASTGSGGWPLSIFMTPEQKPFFAGTYFPKRARYGAIGFIELLSAIQTQWQSRREALLHAAEELVSFLKRPTEGGEEIEAALIEAAVGQFQKLFDTEYGGFGSAPKFPAPHNLLFLLEYFENSGDEQVFEMVTTTLRQLYRGGIFDHIGYGFSRYSTDRFFLVPHFEKMLYDNALLIIAYSRAYHITRNPLLRAVAEKTADYLLRELQSPEGGFYCAQDADSEGVEGKFYLLTPGEILALLGEEEGRRFNARFGITEKGNFEGKNIPNRLQDVDLEDDLDGCLPTLRAYRKSRMELGLDDKCLCSWNCLAIAAFAQLYRVTGEKRHLDTALAAEAFIEEKLCAGETLFVSFREGVRSGRGFLEDYAFYVFAQLALYEATLDSAWLTRALCFCEKTADFHDAENGGFTVYGRENEQLIHAPKESFDGAIPSGNSMMAYVLVRLAAHTQDDALREQAEAQLRFMSAQAAHYPAGHSFFLLALSQYFDPPEHVTVVLKERTELDAIREKLRLSAVLTVLDVPTAEFSLLNDQTTFYICKGRSCQPPTNTL